MSAEHPFATNVIFTEEMANAARLRLREKLASIAVNDSKHAATEIKNDHPMSFDDDEVPSIDDIFPFKLEEKALIEQLEAAVRQRMVSADPETLKKISAFLYALERLPYATPSLFLDLAIMERRDEKLSYVSVELDGQSFRLSTGGSVYSPDVGSDSFSETLIEIETGGFREGSTDDFSLWLEAFVSAGGIIEVEGDDDISLTEPAPDDGWDRLEKYWESHGEDTDGW